MALLNDRYYWFKIVTDMSGTIFVFIAEALAIVPYLLRSLRIERMFAARETYWSTNVMPKEAIAFWREERMVCALLTVVLGSGVPIAILELIQVHNFPTYNIIS